MTVTLTVAQQLQIRQGAVGLQRRFEGQLNAETIERFMNESLEILMARATTSTWVPVLAERFAKDRLRALVR
ncbi:MAG TPA: arsenate reductase ArsC, partial [Acidimicrobiia bacterium]|nr:arsenate reductase ArsC [Acidimicrobiia bacterium]